MKANDSPRWCAVCQKWGDHHTDRCPSALLMECCDHCGCGPGHRVGHDDTCRFGCNDDELAITPAKGN